MQLFRIISRNLNSRFCEEGKRGGCELGMGFYVYQQRFLGSSTDYYGRSELQFVILQNVVEIEVMNFLSKLMMEGVSMVL